MKTLKLLTITAALGLALSAQAAKINGSITFLGGISISDESLGKTSLGGATQVTSWYNPVVLVGDGDFSGIVGGTPVTFVTPYIFSAQEVPALWNVGGFQFNLTSSIISQQDDAFLDIHGLGTIICALDGNNFEETAGTWRFSTQGPSANSIFSFSASSGSVPDGGVTAMLIGGALAGLAFVRRKLA